jgi:NAD(P)-dependent dehydrogenase (short-subunit alcohol dehydrogenase family)
MQDFSGKTAVITGGASGIGHAVASRLAAEGMNLVLADIVVAPLQRVVADFEADGIPVIGVRTDVSSNDDVIALAAATRQRFGDVHVLFNNAGVGGGGPIIDPTNLGVWEWVIGIDLFGVLYGIKAFAGDMIAHGEPCHIVNTASMAGLLSFPGMGAYNVSKFGVVTMSEVLSLETRDTALGVSVLCPGFVRTRIHESDRHLPEHLVPRDGRTPEQEEMRTMIGELIASGKPPEEIADHVVDAIRTERFYILPHPELADQVVARAKAIVAGTTPELGEL